LLLIGFLRTLKARLQNRIGPPLLQPFWDTAKLLRKGETISDATTGAFEAAPLLNLGAVLAAALMIPWLGVAPPIHGDLILVVYALALGKFCLSLAALDTGSSFGAIGASREAAISLQTEPAILLGLAALAAHAHSSDFAAFLTPGAHDAHTVILALLVLVALWMASIADLARMPVDDPTTHLELTMVHEALILENSGRNLALVELAAAVKTAVLLGLIAQVALMMLPRQPAPVSCLLSVVLMAAAAGVIAVCETALVKLRWRRVPNLLSFAVGAGVLACLFVALRG
jgi:formate hydrogenlyase subunit 4